MSERIRQVSESLSQQYRRLDVLAQNVANQDTPGYQATDTGQRNGQFAAWLRQPAGPVISTGRNLDVSLPAGVYLSVQTALGTRYTRRGDLRIDRERRLVTGAGDPVLDESGGLIELGPGTLRLSEDGSVYAGDRAVARLGRFRLTACQETGGTLFSPASGTRPTADASPLHTGELEGSNVGEASEQITLVDVMRRAEALSQVVSVHHQTLAQAIRDLGHR